MSFLRPRASSVSETAKREAWRPGLLFYWDSSTPPEVLLDGIATFPLPECNCTRSQTQRSQWTGCRDVEAEEPIEVLVTVLYVKPQCELSWLYCLHLFAMEIVSWCDWVPPAGLGIRGHRSRRSRHAVWCGRRHWWGRSQGRNQINSVASAHCPFTVSKLGGRDRNDKTWVLRDAVRIIFWIKPEHERMPHYQWLQP